jgi:hypothetical protein
MGENILEYNYNRRFGVELELNAFDQRDFKKNPLKVFEHPAGIHTVTNLVKTETGMWTETEHYRSTHNNYDRWVIKPDSSCGFEVCSPPVKGWEGIEQICSVVNALKKHPSVISDHRCSLHMHLDIGDLSKEQLASVLVYWIKCEAVFLDLMPPGRKRNRYCMSIGNSDMFYHNTPIDPDNIINKLGIYKYLTANTYHYIKKSRTTIEFRIADAAACLNPLYTKNWMRLILHFVEMAARRPLPRPYKSGDPWSSFLWLDPKDVLYLLGFYGNYALSPGMEQTRNWFVERLIKNIDCDLTGIWSKVGREKSKKQILEVAEDLGVLNREVADPVFAEELRI